MTNIKIYSKVGNYLRKDEPFEGFYKFYYLFLKYQSEVVLEYYEMASIFDRNIKEMFKDELNVKNNKNYSNVLAYGDVQSGKTGNMMCAIMWAYENSFKNIFILTGNTKSLHNQTIKRFEKEIKNFHKFLEKKSDLYLTGEINEIEFKEISEYRKKEKPINLRISIYDFLNLIKRKNEEKIKFLNEIEENLKLNKMNIFFVVKNVANYTLMNDVNNLFINLEKRNGVLLIDDEADWGFKSDDLKNIETKLFEKLEEFKKTCLNNKNYLKYIAFTATPYKILNNYNNELLNMENIITLKSKVIENWMSEQFIADNQPFYSGINFFHNGYKKTNFFQNQELNLAFNKEFFTQISDKSNKQETLVMSLLIFLANAYNYNDCLYQLRKEINIVYGLYFPDIIQDSHEEAYEDLISICKILKRNISFIIDKNYFDIENLLNSFTIQNINLIKKLETKINNKNYKLYLNFLNDWISEIERNPDSLIVKMSGEESKENMYNKKKIIGSLNAIFIIGGYKISRGVTFSPLLLETIIKKSDKSDSTLQRARWYGYRDINELKNMDIILSNETFKSFEDAISEDIAWRLAIEKVEHSK